MILSQSCERERGGIRKIDLFWVTVPLYTTTQSCKNSRKHHRDLELVRELGNTTIRPMADIYLYSSGARLRPHVFQWGSSPRAHRLSYDGRYYYRVRNECLSKDLRPPYVSSRTAVDWSSLQINPSRRLQQPLRFKIRVIDMPLELIRMTYGYFVHHTMSHDARNVGGTRCKQGGCCKWEEAVLTRCFLCATRPHPIHIDLVALALHPVMAPWGFKGPTGV